jgi:lysosomal acid lipase/cholesteryl ester hydrolase
LPTIIDFVLQSTGQQNLTYVGHSEGTTQFFLGASLLPEYFTSKVNLFVGLAPVATTANIPSKPIREAAKYIKVIELALMEAKIYNLFPPMPLPMEGALFVCDMPYLKNVCKSILGMLNN